MAVDVFLPKITTRFASQFVSWRGKLRHFLLGHILNSALTWLTIRNYGFSDGADLFVFISGYTAALVFGRMMLNRGFVIGAT
jgi:hypothetical protein